jgi:hypothetical protein
MTMSTKMNRTPLILLAALAAQIACVKHSGDYREQPPDPGLLHEAVRELTRVIVYDIFSPPQASRTYVYASIAGYEALQHG